MENFKYNKPGTPPSYWPTRQLLRLLIKLYILDVPVYTDLMRQQFPTQ